MDIFKKIYTAIMGLTVISVIVLCLSSLNIVDFGSNESLYRILFLAIAFFSISFLFSRSANVVANRKNTALAYIAVVIGLFFVLGSALTLIFDIDFSITTIYVIICILIGITLLILVLEVPPANSSHTKFQIITALLVLIAYIWNVSGLYQSIDNLFTDTEVVTEEIASDDEDINTAKTIITYSAVLCFLLNPMIRVHYLDIDYELTKEIDNIIKEGVGSKNNVPKKTVLPKKEEKKVEEQVPMIQNENSAYINKGPTDTNIPINEPDNTPIQEVVETQGITPDGKVINLNFKQDDLAEAVIPTISGLESPDNSQSQSEIQPEANQTPPPTNLQQPEITNNENKEPDQQ